MSECKVFRREIEEAADGGGVSGGARAHASLCRACGDELRVRESLRALVGGPFQLSPVDFAFGHNRHFLTGTPATCRAGTRGRG